jgi:mono/diheme cytochrome c family protein
MAAVATPRTPVEAETKQFRLRILFGVLLVVFLLGVYLYWRICPEVPERFGADTDHFKYGSIGADNTDRGIPIWLFQVLPEMFPEHLPASDKTGYAAFGFIEEAGADRPIGFSKRRVLGLELVGLNCAVCHTGQYRAAPNAPPQVVLGMPSNTVNLQAFFEFLFKCADDPRYETAAIMERICKKTWLDPIEYVAYRLAIPQFKEKALAQKKLLEYMTKIPKFGPGRIDTFTPYKRLFFPDLPVSAGDPVGTADFPSLWNQRPRQGMHLHWDGNNESVDERNISAALGAGVRAHPSSLDEPSMKRVHDWIFDLAPPAFPADKLDPFKVRHGAFIYARHCAECHDWKGARIGQVVKIDQIQTDPHRLESFSAEMARRMNTLGEGYAWHFRHFKKQDGYANSPLDGIWLRGPYLHNGAVPTLRHLLMPAKDRPQKFWRGNDLYDWKDVGFVWNEPKSCDRPLFEFDTALPGNGNGGHEYGTKLSAEERDALLEYLKTL